MRKEIDDMLKELCFATTLPVVTSFKLSRCLLCLRKATYQKHGSRMRKWWLLQAVGDLKELGCDMGEVFVPKL